MTSITRNDDIKNKSHSRIKIILRTLAVILIYLIVWIIIAGIVNQEILIPKPSSVFRSLSMLVLTDFFWISVITTIWRILTGFLIALIFGTCLAVITAKSKIAEIFFYPLISAIRATPVASFIILALFWFATGNMPVFICFLMVLPNVWTNISEGIKGVDKDLIEMAQAYGFTKFAKLRYIYVPTVMPFLRAAFTTGLGLAWKAGVAAEVIGKPDFSIGKELYNAKIYLEMPDMFAWTLVVILISVVLEKLLIWFVNHIGKRYGGYRI